MDRPHGRLEDKSGVESDQEATESISGKWKQPFKRGRPHRAVHGAEERSGRSFKTSRRTKQSRLIVPFATNGE